MVIFSGNVSCGSTLPVLDVAVPVLDVAVPVLHVAVPVLVDVAVVVTIVLVVVAVAIGTTAPPPTDGQNIIRSSLPPPCLTRAMPGGECNCDSCNGCLPSTSLRCWE